MAPTRERRSAHDPGVVLRDLAVSIADGGDCLTDLGVLRGQESLFGAVASESTAHRVLKSIDPGLLEAIRGARAERPLGQDLGGGRSAKDDHPRYRRLTARRPLREGREPRVTTRAALAPSPCSAYLEETGEALAGLLRPGNAGANTAADHSALLQLALQQLPEADLDREILVRTDSAGQTHAFTQDCRDADIRFSVGYEVDARVREAILCLSDSAWEQAINARGAVREGAQVTELSDRVDLCAWPEGTRLIVRRERPHPGAQFSVFDADGYRHTAFITDQAGEDIASLELRHRRRARVEDSIPNGKERGCARCPSPPLSTTRPGWRSPCSPRASCAGALLCLEGELLLAEPKRIRQRLLHVAGRIVCSGRRRTLRLPRSWPWADGLAAAFTRLRALPVALSP